MSWKGLSKKEDFMPIFAYEWNLIIEALDELYLGITTGTMDIYVRSITAVTGNFYESLYVAGKYVDPPPDEDPEEALYVSPKAVETLELEVDTQPKPLKPCFLKIRRAVIKSHEDNFYTVWLGNSREQKFPIKPGEKEEVHVDDAYKIWLRADGRSKVYALLELLEEK